MGGGGGAGPAIYLSRAPFAAAPGPAGGGLLLFFGGWTVSGGSAAAASPCRCRPSACDPCVAVRFPRGYHLPRRRTAVVTV